MKTLRLLICLVILTLTATDRASFASDLPGCSNNWHNCFGTYTDDSGTYVGEWRDGRPDGEGTHTHADGSKLIGEWKDGQQHGEGIFFVRDTFKYSGEFKNGEFNGKGLITFGLMSRWAGDQYHGEFKNNHKHGLGTYIYADGRVEEGVWKRGEFQYARALSPPTPVAKAPAQENEIISASSGSGCAVSYKGHVVTNNHVIKGCQKVVVHQKGDKVPVKIIAFDPKNDLAILKGDFTPVTVFPLSNDRPELLQDVYVAGYPFGKEISTSVKVTKGIISSLTGIGNNFSNIQIDAALQPGNSGGPILDEKGNLVGVAVAKLDLDYVIENYGVVPEGTNFGIKSSVVKNLLDSNEVHYPPANASLMSKSQLGANISTGTYYISCWMTVAQIQKMRANKVLFTDLN